MSGMTIRLEPDGGYTFHWPDYVLKARDRHSAEQQKLANAASALHRVMVAVVQEDIEPNQLPAQLKELDVLLTKFKRQTPPTYKAKAHQLAEQERAWDETPNWKNYPLSLPKSPAQRKTEPC